MAKNRARLNHEDARAGYTVRWLPTMLIRAIYFGEVALLFLASCSSQESRRLDRVLSANPNTMAVDDILFLYDKWSELNESLIGCTESRKGAGNEQETYLNARGQCNLKKREQIDLQLTSITFCPLHHVKMSRTAENPEVKEIVIRMLSSLYSKNKRFFPLCPRLIAYDEPYCNECVRILEKLG